MKDSSIIRQSLYLSGYLHFSSIALQLIARSKTQTIHFNCKCSFIFIQRSSIVTKVFISVAGAHAACITRILLWKIGILFFIKILTPVQLKTKLISSL